MLKQGLDFIFQAFLLTAVFCLSCGSTGFAANYQWKQLDGKERLTLTMLPSDGIPGGIARIDAQALIIPFTEVPVGLLFDKTPDGAHIVKDTSLLGHALAIHTQTPEFGYVIIARKPKEIIIDFFHDPLGARWKPFKELAPTTEIAPPEATVELTPTEPASPTASPQEQKSLDHALINQKGTAKNKAEEANRPVGNKTKTQSELPLSANSTLAASTQSEDKSKQASQNATEGISQKGESGTNTTTEMPPAPTGRLAPQEPLRNPALKPLLPMSDEKLAKPQPNPYATASPPAIEAGSLGIAIAPQEAPSSFPQILANASTLEHQSTPGKNDLPTPLPLLDTQAIQDSAPSAQASSVSQTASMPAQDLKPPSSSEKSPEKLSPMLQKNASTISPPVSQTIPGTEDKKQIQEQPNRSYIGIEDEKLPVGTAVFTGPGISYRAKINPGGIENLSQVETPQETGLSDSPQTDTRSENDQDQSVALPSPPASPQPLPSIQKQDHSEALPQKNKTSEAPHPLKNKNASQGEPTASPAEAGGKSKESQPAVIYVDETGKPVPPPLDPEEALPKIREDMNAKKFQEALDAVEPLLKQTNLNELHREEALHLKAEALFAMNQNDFKENYFKIKEATQRAINFKQSSPRNAAALLRLGYMNLKLNNVPEAEANFAMLRRQFPDDDNVPLSYYYWGDYYYQKGDISRAADQFQYILQKYANSRFAREAALGLARSFYRLGYFDQSFEIVEYIEKRWPRFYLDYPPFLTMMGDVAFHMKRYELALRFYWLYTNLEPSGQDADAILTKIGDTYTLQRQNKAAKQVYSMCAKKFPDKDGGLVARMRLAEATINDDPTIANMFSIFDRPFDISPQEVYSSIINEHPQSALVPMAELKLAMWQLWKKDYIAALDTCTQFEKKFPKHELLPKIKEVALKTFATMAAASVSDGRYGRMQEIWNRYPIVQAQQEILSPESRVALGVSLWKDGKLNGALETIDPFFLGDKIPTYSEMALTLALNIYLYAEQWPAIQQVADQVALWELSPATKQQLNYALALSDENLDKSTDAAPLWQSLYTDPTLPPQQMAYVAYFLAKDAERHKDLEKAYQLGNDALNRLLTLVQTSPNQADLGKIKNQLGSLMDIAETAGRLNEAVDYAQRYLSYLDPQDQARAGLEYRLGRIYKRQGNNDEWRKIMSALTKNFPDSIYARTAASELKEEAIQKESQQYAFPGQG